MAGENGHGVREVDGGIHEDGRDAQATLAEPCDEQFTDRTHVGAIDASLAVHDDQVCTLEASEQLIDPGDHPSLSTTRRQRSRTGQRLPDSSRGTGASLRPHS